MELIDWLAVLGALSWLPHLVKLYRDKFINAEIEIITQKTPELGFTTFGAILNIRLAFAVAKKDIVISGIKLHLNHESGQEKEFEWQGITQQVLKMDYPEIGSVPFQKENSVLAIKLKTNEIEERLIRFQMPTFIERKNELEQNLIKRASYLGNGRFEDIDKDKLLNSDELTDLSKYIKHEFIWKPGKYTIQFELESSDNFHIKGDEYSFVLTQVEVEDLEKNKESIEDSFKYRIKEYEEDEEPEQVYWNWLNPLLKSAT